MTPTTKLIVILLAASLPLIGAVIYFVKEYFRGE